MNKAARIVIRISTLLIAVLVGTCQHHKSDLQVKQSKLEFILSDFKTQNKAHPKEMLEAVNQVEGFGRMGSGLLHKHKADSIPYWYRDKFTITSQRSTFELIVDTMNILPMSLRLDDYMDSDHPIHYTLDSTYETSGSLFASFEAVPVYIINRDTIDHALEFHDNAVHMIYEAQDSLGQWQPIEFWPDYVFCGNSHYRRIFKPGYYLVGKVLKLNGSYQTKMRLKLKNFDQVIYSEAFAGEIDYNQFDDAFVREASRKLVALDRKDSILFYAQQMRDEMFLKAPNSTLHLTK
ncbi:MAG: hypothetical protein AAGA02_15255 [Bacteroidota bacterium]